VFLHGSVIGPPNLCDEKSLLNKHNPKDISNERSKT